MTRKLKICLPLVALMALMSCFSAMNGYEKNPSLPAVGGALKVEGLRAEVNVYRDAYGIPHIMADNEHDLFFAAGYVQAQDRLWEMILFRALAQGRMAEIFGDVGVPGVRMSGYSLSTAAIDRRQRIMGMKYMGEVAAALVRETDPRVYGQLQSFCGGVNAFIDSHQKWEQLPVEFQILRIRPEHWTPADCESFGRFIGSMLCGNMEVELNRFAAIKKFGEEKGWELFPLFGGPGIAIVPKEILANKLASPRALPPGGRPSDEELGEAPALTGNAAMKLLLAEQAVRLALRIDPSFGSNNWVVSGKLTASGNAILCNDPHLNHMEPSLFYLMHLMGAGIDAFGASFPGNPYIVLGHTRRLAWGATTSRSDVQDLFVETVDPKRPGMYLYRGEWRPFIERTETIRVRVGSRLVGRELKIRQSVHGPIMNEIAPDLPPGTPPVALRWTGWDLSRDLRAFELAVSSRSPDEFIARFRALPQKFEVKNICMAYDLLMRGQSLDDFIRAMDLLDLPNQNWIAADWDGRIAYLPGGLVPVRGKGIGVLPVPGASGGFDWTGFIPTMELPHGIDPARGYMASANGEVVDAEWYPYVFATSYGEPWRGMRIEELIQELTPLDMKDMERIQNDVYVRRAEWEVPIILRAVTDKKVTDPRVLRAAAELKNWDYEADLDSTATVIFFEFVKDLMRNTLEDEAGKGGVKHLQFEGYPDMAINIWLTRGSSEFFDDVRTGGVVEDMDDMIVKSLGDAMARVEKKYGPDPEDRRWGKIHYIKFYHLLGLGPGGVMSVGPFPHLGADQTVRMAKAAGFGRKPYKTLMGPCFRHIMDLGDPDGALLVIDGSESGQWLSPHYDDMHQLWLGGEYVTAVMDAEKVKARAADHLLLTP